MLRLQPKALTWVWAEGLAGRIRVGTETEEGLPPGDAMDWLVDDEMMKQWEDV